MPIVKLNDWPDYYNGWAMSSSAFHSGSAVRSPTQIRGCIRVVRTDCEFAICGARDCTGSVIRLAPEVPQSPFKTGGQDDREWRGIWSQVAVRAAYMTPEIDARAFDLLCRARAANERIEFIVDTNVIVNGVGHWLTRWFGDVADLVRTVVTDLEVQSWVDGNHIWSVKSVESLRRRFCYLSSSRFLERIAHGHPIWRRLDIEEETALFVNKAGAGGSRSKSPGADVLMLRAVRRQVLDQVPRLRRFFVTSDQALARSAVHDLPLDAVITAYVNPLPDRGRFLGNVHWWPSKPGRSGACVAGLPVFIYEATSVCDSVIVRLNDGREMKVSAYIPDINQYPSDWVSPCLFVEESKGNLFIAPPEDAPSSPSPMPEPSTPATTEPAFTLRESVSVEIPPRIVGMQGGASASWPLSDKPLPATNDCSARVSIPHLMAITDAVMLAVLDGRNIPEHLLDASVASRRETKTFLRAAGVLSDSGPGTAAIELPTIYATNDVDSLARVFAQAANFGRLLDQLRQEGEMPATNDDFGRATSSLVNLARCMGQAVESSGRILDGSAFVSAESLLDWLSTLVTREMIANPLGEVPLSFVAKEAMEQLRLSPSRLARALLALRGRGDLSQFSFSAGGTPEPFLVESVIQLGTQGSRRVDVGADNMLGYRTIARKSQ